MLFTFQYNNCNTPLLHNSYLMNLIENCRCFPLLPFLVKTPKFSLEKLKSTAMLHKYNFYQNRICQNNVSKFYDKRVKTQKLYMKKQMGCLRHSIFFFSFLFVPLVICIAFFLKVWQYTIGMVDRLRQTKENSRQRHSYVPDPISYIISFLVLYYKVVFMTSQVNS